MGVKVKSMLVGKGSAIGDNGLSMPQGANGQRRSAGADRKGRILNPGMQKFVIGSRNHESRACALQSQVASRLLQHATYRQSRRLLELRRRQRQRQRRNPALHAPSAPPCLCLSSPPTKFTPLGKAPLVLGHRPTLSEVVALRLLPLIPPNSVADNSVPWRACA